MSLIDKIQSSPERGETQGETFEQLEKSAADLATTFTTNPQAKMQLQNSIIALLRRATFVVHQQKQGSHE